MIFPHNQMQILPYNRVLKDLNGLTPAQLLEKLEAVFAINPRRACRRPRANTNWAFISTANGTRWRSSDNSRRSDDPIEQLDVTLLQKHVLAPVFGIDDPRTSKRINFVGGIRGTAELEKLVNSGEYACAFSMFPTSIEDLMSHRRRGRHHAAQEHLVRAEAARRDVLPHDLIVRIEWRL